MKQNPTVRAGVLTPINWDRKDVADCLKRMKRDGKVRIVRCQNGNKVYFSQQITNPYTITTYATKGEIK